MQMKYSLTNFVAESIRSIYLKDGFLQGDNLTYHLLRNHAQTSIRNIPCIDLFLCIDIAFIRRIFIGCRAKNNPDIRQGSCVEWRH
jgi:hypothetical protein